MKGSGRWFSFAIALSVAAAIVWASGRCAAQETPPDMKATATPLPELTEVDKALPINLPTALQLAQTNALDISVASERIRIASAQLQRANVLWLPTVLVGTDYFRHDGQIQDVAGKVFGVSKSTFMVGATPNAIFALTDAIFAPLAARQVVRARQADVQTASNDTMLAVAEAYFNVQQARGEVAGALDVVRRAEELSRRAKELSAGLVPPVEEVRARTELFRRRQILNVNEARWRTASAELVRILRLDPSLVVRPIDPPHLTITLLPLDRPVDDLIPIGLTNRPELASQQALVQAALARLRQERIRPLIPSVLLRGGATNPAGTLAGGLFGGGINSNIKDFSARSDFDIQVLWELQNLGIGNRARIRENEAERRTALLELFRAQDRVAAEVVQAFALAQAAASRLSDAENELKDAIDSYDKNLAGVGQTKSAGGLVILVIRPQEVVAAIQALGQAYFDYYSTVADYNRAQFRLYRALGHPAQCVLRDSEQIGDSELVATNREPRVRNQFSANDPARLNALPEATHTAGPR